MHAWVGCVEDRNEPARKLAKLITNSGSLAEALDRTCDGKHEHPDLLEGRAADAAMHPKELCTTISRAVVRQIQYDRQGLICVSSGNKKEIGGFLSSLAKKVDDRWPAHCKEDKHEEDGGDAKDMLKEELCK